MPEKQKKLRTVDLDRMARRPAMSSDPVWTPPAQQRGRKGAVGSSPLIVIDMALGLIDNAGKILMANEAWRTFASDHQLGDNYTIDAYIQRFCEKVALKSDDGAGMVIEGIQAVLKGERETFDFKYSAHSLNEERWFEGTVHRLDESGAGSVFISHSLVKVLPRK